MRHLGALSLIGVLAAGGCAGAASTHSAPDANGYLFGSLPKSCAATVLVPLYVYPGPLWTQVRHERAVHPGTSITVIVNPNSGPGPQPDPQYASGVAKLRSAGAKVLGYNHTSYGARAESLVNADTKSYHDWYSVDGIFFDEMANTSGHESYYTRVNAYAKSLGMHLTIGNPGTDTLPSYVGTVDTMVIYENPGYPPLSRFGGWHAQHPASTWGSISHSTRSLSISKVCGLAGVAGYIYITNDTPPNPYDTLPPYFDRLVGTL